MSLPEGVIQNLIAKSIEAKRNTYSPYSNFPVGAALLCDDGKTVFCGCNMENVSYGLTICAERSAYSQAIAAGHRKFQAIAISSDLADQFIVPCGMCRQTMLEFSQELIVIMTKTDGSYKLGKLSELLPDSFSPSALPK